MGLNPTSAPMPRDARWRRLAPWALLLLAGLGGLYTAQQALARRSLQAAVRVEAAQALARQQALARAGPEGAATAASAASAAGVLPPAAPGPLRFARAQSLASTGQLDQALSQYRGLQEDPVLGASARFNAANALMRRALQLREAGQPNEAYPMVELAKAGYRELLRRDPTDAGARYNLERALRLNPEQEAEDLAATAPARGERAATTMKAVSQGLP